MQEFPKLTEDHGSILVMCWFPTPNVFVWVDLLKVADYADAFEKIALLSFLQTNYDDVANFDLSKTANLRKYALMAGDNSIKYTRAQMQMKEQLKKSKPASFTTGYLYSEYRIIEYDPSKLMIPN